MAEPNPATDQQVMVATLIRKNILYRYRLLDHSRTTSTGRKRVGSTRRRGTFTTTSGGTPFGTSLPGSSAG
jgi:hypothetical protein